MPSIEAAKRIQQVRGKTLGETKRNNTAQIVANTWDNDPQTLDCYLYSYDQDLHPERLGGEGSREFYSPVVEQGEKIFVRAKFIVKGYDSYAKDQVEYYLEFKPNSVFNVKDSQGKEVGLYAQTQYEKKYTEYCCGEFPIGLYIDIPDDVGNYHKWIICKKLKSAQFVRYIILPCNHIFTWINDNTKYIMSGVSRMQSSYNSGVWRDYVVESVQNIDLMVLPGCPNAGTIFYNNRFIIDSRRPSNETELQKIQPLCWRITKVQNNHPSGLFVFTLYQCKYNPKVDVYDFERRCWWAGYDELAEDSDKEEPVQDYNEILYAGANQNIKLQGSYKTYTAVFKDKDGTNVTPSYYTSMKWMYDLYGTAIEINTVLDKKSGKQVYKDENVSCILGDTPDIIKIKFIGDRMHLHEIMKLTNTSNGITDVLPIEIVSVL